MDMGLIISPSILNSNFINLQREIEMLNASEADWIHLDIMDGVFVPNISFGQHIVAAIHAISKKPLDVHLMIIDPDRYIDEFAAAGASNITVHFEACNHLFRTIQYIKQKGLRAGVAINPHTPVQELEEVLSEIDLILNMTVNPGFGGQSFIESSYEKIIRLKELIIKKNSKALIEVDGGVDLKNAKLLKNAGVDIIVAGSSIFKSQSPRDTIKKFKRIE
jgi:ribulose-phosphate 3-epimerase